MKSVDLSDIALVAAWTGVIIITILGTALISSLLTWGIVSIWRNIR
jgi:hypothetical protein